MLDIRKCLLLLFALYSAHGKVTNTRYYPQYHLAPKYGWMNDPNGFCVFRNEYHLFYQYNPESSKEPGIAHWGHAKSSDLFHWEHLPIAMYPDMWYDKTGVFSGSAIVEQNTMYLFYTGNVKKPNDTLPHREYQALAKSFNGVNVTKFKDNPVIMGDDRQPDIRDPKVWKRRDTYYMVLGNAFKSDIGTTLGRILLYKSKDKVDWQEVTTLDESNGTMGYMYECPDFFELNGHFVLLFSPQGLKAEGDKYKNLYQTGYIVGDFSYKTNKFTPLTEFVELDNGHDFYATQTILDKKNRRLLVSWLDMWEQNYPEGDDGFTGQMSLVRKLTLTKDLHLLQEPVSEALKVRSKVLYMGDCSSGKKVFLPNNAGEILVEAPANKNFKLLLTAAGSMVVTISYDAKNGKISLDRKGKDNLRRTSWKPMNVLKLRIFIDASSIEVFCGKGEVTFSSRIFPNGKLSVEVPNNVETNKFKVFEMKHTVPNPN